MKDWQMAQFYDRLMGLRYASGETRKLRDLFAEFVFVQLPEEMQNERHAIDPGAALPLNQPARVAPGAAGEPPAVAYPGQQFHVSKNVRITAPPPGAPAGPVMLPQQPVQTMAPMAGQSRPGALMDGNTLLSGSVQTRQGQTVRIMPAPGSAAQMAAIAIARGEEPPPPPARDPAAQPMAPAQPLPPVSRNVAMPTVHNPPPTPDPSSEDTSDAVDEQARASTKPPAELSVSELGELASALEIEGRSKMNREELIDAIAEAQSDDGDGDDQDGGDDGDE